MNDKNIDRLFQEQLKNLEATPNKRVWNTIESKLKKKKRGLIPFWWFSGGIAALFLVGLFFFPLNDDEIKFDQIEIKNSVTENPKEKKEESINHKKTVDSILQNNNSEEKILVAHEKEPKKQKNTLNNNEEEKKELVSTKNAMKKIFLANNSLEKDSIYTKKELKNSPKNDSLFLGDKKQHTAKKLEERFNTKKATLPNITEKKDTILITKPIKNKWAIAPVFGVLSSNSFSNSSPISENLSNTTQGKNSFSFGLQVAYKINKKWTIQSGIHQQEISYANNQISAVSVNASRSSLSSISFKNATTFTFENSVNLEVVSESSFIKSSNLSGNLNQTFGYIEIPIEIKYNFLTSRKFDTHVVAGFSSLFLNRNQVDLNSQFLSQSGVATNLNNLNFSGNLGFDFSYLVTKNWSLNFNPMFKAQLNTFSDNANGFSPFNIGVYTGIRYKF